MKVTITEYSRLAKDADGNSLPMGEGRLASQVLTAAGASAALNASARLIRVATDTAIHIDPTGGAVTTADELLPANSVEFFSVDGGEELNILTA